MRRGTRIAPALNPRRSQNGRWRVLELPLGEKGNSGFMLRFPRDVYTQTLVCVLLGIIVTGVVLILAGIVLDWLGIP